MLSDLTRFVILSSILALAPQVHAAQQPTRLFAAASLADALSIVVSDFETAQPSSRVVLQFGGSNDLARQILAGAPANLFFSANRLQLDRVAAEGFVLTDARADVLSNELVVVRHRDHPDTVDDSTDLVALERIAIADPEAVPAGVYTRQYLERIGLWSRLRRKVVPTLDVRGALAAVASGNIDAGFVYRTDAAIEQRVKIIYTVPREEGPPISYALGLIREENAAERADVRALYDYLRGEAAAKVFEKFGFIPLARDR